MQENQQENEDKPEDPPPKSGGLFKELLIYVIAMVVMTVAAVAVVTILFKDNSEAEVPEQDPKANVVERSDDEGDVIEPNAPVYTFDPPIVVNTADFGATRFLSVKIHIVFRKADAKSQLEGSDALKYQLRDVFISAFAAKSAAELQDNTVKEEMKKYLKNRINQLLGGSGVKQVYFSEYVIQ